MNYHGQLDLTKAGIIARKHPELVKKVMFKDGTEHMLLNISIFDLQQPDKIGNTATIKVRCKKEDQVEGVNYYLGNIKESEERQQQPAAQPAACEQDDFQPPTDPADLPF